MVKASQKNKQQKEQLYTITQAVLQEEIRLRDKYTFLQHQNLISVFILTFALSGMLLMTYLYSNQLSPAWFVIIASAIFASLSHELEHDLIHKLYFRKNPVIHNFMLLIVWIMRPNTVNPWYRRKIHLLHHKVSGTPEDLEERLVGNGIQNTFLRLVVIFDGLIGMTLRYKTLTKEVRAFNYLKVLNAGFPLAVGYYLCIYSFVIFHSVNYFYGNTLIYQVWVLNLMEVINFLMVVIIAPNILRSACLNMVTSYLHYYGGVTHTLQQTQVFKGWLMWPLHLFCFNFGGTHAIHHIVVKQPFYIRQMLATEAHKVMRANGVRFNDLSTFTQGNKYRAVS